MSYDVRIWCVRKPVPPADVTAPDWQLSITIGDAEPDTIPEQVAQLLPGAAWFADLSLSPLGAPEAGYAALARAQLAIVETAHGIVEDPQAETLDLSNGERRPIAAQRGRPVSLLQLGWWVADDALRRDHTLDDVVDVLKRHLRGAIARRYYGEPGKFIYAERGEEHFRAFLRDNKNHVLGGVYQTTKPVVGFSLSNWEPPGEPNRLGYRANLLGIQVDADILGKPDSRTALFETWLTIARILRPFYGDVRVLDGYSYERGTIWSDAHTEEHPVLGWWWNGIPTSPPLAAVIGEPYRTLWPAFGAVDADSGLAFGSAPTWEPDRTIAESDWAVPARIAQPDAPDRRPGHSRNAIDQTYPPLFPFPKPEGR